MNASIFDLSGKLFWIFGGAGYLGQSVVRALDQQNAEVICIDLPGKAEALICGSDLSGRVRAVSLDMAEIDAVNLWIRTESANRPPDGAAFLTTPLSSTRFEALSAEELNRYNETGVTALFCAVRETGEAMARRGRGSLVLFSSMYGQVAPDPKAYVAPMNPNPLQYGMQKAAINQMTKYLAVMWGPRNVRCNAVAPGPFPNPAVQEQEPDFVNRLAERVPMGRIGTAPEIAGAVAFLLSDAASYVNGHNLVVDGGWTAW